MSKLSVTAPAPRPRFHHGEAPHQQALGLNLDAAPHAPVAASNPDGAGERAGDAVGAWTAMDLRRVAVVGPSGAGKTTFAADLARPLRLPHIELDGLYWRPGWIAAPPHEFRAAVAAATAGERWVSDGNYSAVRDLVWGRATAVIWLNYPFLTVLWRGLCRTMRRAVLGEQLYGGNRDTLRRAFLSRHSILWWVVTTHRRRRQQYTALFAGREFRDLHLLELRHPREAARFLRHRERVPAQQGAA